MLWSEILRSSGLLRASISNFVPTYRENKSVLPSGFKNLLFFWGGGDSWNLRIGPIVHPETSVRNYQYSPHNNSDECSSWLLRGGSVKLRILWASLNNYVYSRDCAMPANRKDRPLQKLSHRTWAWEIGYGLGASVGKLAQSICYCCWPEFRVTHTVHIGTINTPVNKGT